MSYWIFSGRAYFFIFFKKRVDKSVNKVYDNIIEVDKSVNAKKKEEMIMNIKNGMRFYDECNGRYITTDGQGCNPTVWHCVVEEINDNGDFEIADTQLFTEYELKRFKEV